MHAIIYIIRTINKKNWGNQRWSLCLFSGTCTRVRPNDVSINILYIAFTKQNLIVVFVFILLALCSRTSVGKREPGEVRHSPTQFVLMP